MAISPLIKGILWAWTRWVIPIHMRSAWIINAVGLAIAPVAAGIPTYSWGPLVLMVWVAECMIPAHFLRVCRRLLLSGVTRYAYIRLIESPRPWTELYGPPIAPSEP